jgi:hypothetical protein
MRPTAQQVLEQLNELEDDEREAVIEAARTGQPLVALELHPQWDGEIGRRLESVRSGKVKPIPAEVVSAKMQRIIDGL